LPPAVFCLVFAVFYRVFCPDTFVQYNGHDVQIRDIPWHGVLYISLQSFGGFNTAWDFGDDSQSRFRYINTIQTFLGLIVATFFVGASPRMILGYRRGHGARAAGGSNRYSSSTASSLPSS